MHVFSHISISFFAVPPTKIEFEGLKSGSRLNVRENEIVELKCIVHQAKPKATIVWFRENTEFFSGKTDYFYTSCAKSLTSATFAEREDAT